MPPRVKFTKEEITSAALDLVRKQGPSALTARGLGKKLGCSSRPIFTAFSGMDELREEVTASAKNIYKSYVDKGLAQSLPFKGAGTEYIHFASQEPKLFQLLFMAEKNEVPSLSLVLPLIDESYEAILQSVMNTYQMSRPLAEKLYRHLWIYTHGIATLSVTQMCRFSSEEIDRMLSEVCMSLIRAIKGGFIQ
jgi:AcrR family transcriptional regulator